MTDRRRKCYFANGRSDPQIGGTERRSLLCLLGPALRLFNLKRLLAARVAGGRRQRGGGARGITGARSVALSIDIERGRNGTGKLELLPITTLSEPVVVRASLEVIQRNSSITFAEHGSRVAM